MRQQLTAEAIVVLVSGLIVFWVGIAGLVRHHASKRAASRVARGATETRG